MKIVPESLVDPAFDSKVTAAFAKRQLDVLNSVALCLVVSLGHRKGLFDVLRILPPAKSKEVGARAELQER